MYCGGSELKYPGTVAKNVCSIVLEICPTPNPALNLSDSVDKCNCYKLLFFNWYKNVFVDATMLFELPYMQIRTVMSNRSYTGLEPELLTSQVRLRTPWATEQT